MHCFARNFQNNLPGVRTPDPLAGGSDPLLQQPSPIWLYTRVSGSGSATGEVGHYGSHPRPQVVDRGTPSRMDKRVAPDKEGAADKQCLRRRKTLIPNWGRWSSLSLFRQIHLGEGKSEYNLPFSGLRAASTWEAVGFCGSHRQTDVLAKLSSWLGG